MCKCCTKWWGARLDDGAEMLRTCCCVFSGVPSVALDALYIQQMVPSVEVRLTLALWAFQATYLAASLFVQVPKYLLCDRTPQTGYSHLHIHRPPCTKFSRIL